MTEYEWTRTATKNLLFHQKKFQETVQRVIPESKAYKKRVSQWLLAAGLLDALNANDFYVAEALESYKPGFVEFHAVHAATTDNFADIASLKDILYTFVFHRGELFEEVEDPFLLLGAVVEASASARRLSRCGGL